MNTNMVQNSLIKNAQNAFEAWDSLGIHGRVECLEQVLTSLSEKQRQMAAWQIKNAQNQLSETKVMPGPTGEHNELSTQGRGVFLCTSSMNTEKADIGFIGQIFAALIAGNPVIAVAQTEQKIIQNTMNSMSPFVAAGVIQHATEAELDTLINAENLAGMATLCNTEQEKQLNQRLTEKDGLLCQLVAETDSETLGTISKPHYILRFVTERTVSINTTAIGGNATLLELGSMEE